MTEKQIRAQVVATAEAWLGVRAGSAEHANILKIYNAQKPLPRGTRMKDVDPWCAAFVSAVSLKLGYRDIMPTEMSCHQMITLYKQLGRWEENDAYVPSPGDVIMYDWGDGKNYAKTDNTGTPDHVGIVAACDGKTISVVEGNNERHAVGIRPVEVNGRFIRGFGIPDYASKATEEEPTNKADDLARKIASEINDSGLDAAQVLAKVTALLGNTDKPAEPEKPTEPPAEPEKPAYDVDKIALEVLNGKWGNGTARRRRLTAAGYDYRTVQNRVNEIDAERRKK